MESTIFPRFYWWETLVCILLSGLLGIGTELCQLDSANLDVLPHVF